MVKPAPTTPLATLRFAELIKDVLPPGVLNVITDANDLGDEMTKHPDIRKISFTGSTATGKKVMASAAQTLKRITLELGGNDAGIVLDDVDPKKVAPGIFDGAFQNTGQVCIAIKRLYVHESVYDEMCNELVELAKSAVVGDGVKQGTKLGPLQNKMQYEKVKGFLEDARKNGKIVAGGAAMDRPGYFIDPTIVRDIAEGSQLVDEEQFGPVLPVIKYSDKDDAIRRANATTYGLGGSVWSSDIKRAHEVATADGVRHGLDQQAPRHGPAHPVRRRQAVGHRHRVGRGRPGGIHPAPDHQRPAGRLIRQPGSRRNRRGPFICNETEANHVRCAMRSRSPGLRAASGPRRGLAHFAADLKARGFRVVGMVQAGQCANSSLSAVLLHSGEKLLLAQDFDPAAQGCRLDLARLQNAGMRIADALSTAPISSSSTASASASATARACPI